MKPRATTSLLLVALVAGTAMILTSDGEAGGGNPLEDAVAKKRTPEQIAEAKAKAREEDRKEHGDEHAGAPPISAIREKAGAGCLADEAALEDLRKQREAGEARAKDLAAKELGLKARERALDEQLKKLEQIREEIARIEGGYKKDNQEKVAKLVETFESMSPKASAQLLATIDDGLAIAAMSQMSTLKLSKVLNVMDAERASKLTELLAGVTRAKTLAKSKPRESTSPTTPQKRMDVAEVTDNQSAKGGEKENGHTNNEQQPVNAAPNGAPQQREPAAEKGKGPSH